MKIKLLISCLAVLLFGCNDQEAKLKKIHYLFIVDDPSPAVIEGFKTRITGGKAMALQNEQPKDIKQITFTVYIPTPSTTRLSVSFIDDMELQRKTARRNDAKAFLDTLNKCAGKTGGDRYILKAMEGVLSEIKDPATDYNIFFISNMVENSGGSNSLQSDDWRNGNFHFVNDKNNCLPAPLNEAIRQLDDSSSWINQHLIAKAKREPLLKKQRFFYSKIAELYKTNEGCDDYNVNVFWEKLFSKVGDSYAVKQASELNVFLAFEKEDIN